MENNAINEEQSERLLKIINWALKNGDLWNNIFLYTNSEITVAEMQGLIDEFKTDGITEMYFFCIMKLAEAAGLYHMDGRFFQFLDACLAGGTVLYKDKILPRP